MALWDSKTVDLMIYVLSPKNASYEKLRHHINHVVCSNTLKMIQLLTNRTKEDGQIQTTIGHLSDSHDLNTYRVKTQKCFITVR